MFLDKSLLFLNRSLLLKWQQIIVKKEYFYKRLQFLQNWSDCLENLTRQRHDREQTENQQNAATVDSCFELVGSRQLGVAQQKVEQPTRVEWSTKCTWWWFRMGPNSDIRPRHSAWLRTMNKRYEISCRCCNKSSEKNKPFLDKYMAKPC